MELERRSCFEENRVSERCRAGSCSIRRWETNSKRESEGRAHLYGDTGESLTHTIKKHSYAIRSVDFSPDGAVLVTGSYDKTTKL